MKDLKLPQAIVITAALFVLGGLVWAGKDMAAVIGGVLAVLGAFGYSIKQQAEVKEQNVAIKEQTNGNQRELLNFIIRQHEDLVRLSNKMADKMAEMQLPPKKE